MQLHKGTGDKTVLSSCLDVQTYCHAQGPLRKQDPLVHIYSSNCISGKPLLVASLPPVFVNGRAAQCLHSRQLHVHVCASAGSTPQKKNRVYFYSQGHCTRLWMATLIPHPTYQWDKVRTVFLSITSQSQVTIYSWPCCEWDGWDLQEHYRLWADRNLSLVTVQD